MQDEIKEVLGIKSETTNEQYLRLPVHIGKSRVSIFTFLKDRIWKKIQGWKEKTLSRAGKEILIKVVAQAIPTYTMSCFEITRTICEQISSLIGRYCWNNQEKGNKINWINWETLTRPKGEGGLGFRDIYAFNIAMLARQA